MNQAYIFWTTETFFCKKNQIIPKNRKNYFNDYINQPKGPQYEFKKFRKKLNHCSYSLCRISHQKDTSEIPQPHIFLA